MSPDCTALTTQFVFLKNLGTNAKEGLVSLLTNADGFVAFFLTVCVRWKVWQIEENHFSVSLPSNYTGIEGFKKVRNDAQVHTVK